MNVRWKLPVIAATVVLVSAVLFLVLYNLVLNNENRDYRSGNRDYKNEGKDISMELIELKEYKLSEPVKTGNMSVEEAIAKRRSVRTYSSSKITESNLSQLLWAAQGITDKAGGLRTAPSAGALYPLEIYVVTALVEGIEEGLYKYNPLSHTLILKKSGNILEDIYNVSLRQDSIKNAAAVIIYCAVFERTAWRYKDRAAQYVYIETGHSAQNVYLQAEALNLGTVAIGAFDNKGIRKVLGLPDEEEPVYLMPVGKK